MGGVQARVPTRLPARRQGVGGRVPVEVKQREAGIRLGLGEQALVGHAGGHIPQVVHAVDEGQLGGLGQQVVVARAVVGQAAEGVPVQDAEDLQQQGAAAFGGHGPHLATRHLGADGCDLADLVVRQILGGDEAAIGLQVRHDLVGDAAPVEGGVTFGSEDPQGGRQGRIGQDVARAEGLGPDVDAPGLGRSRQLGSQAVQAVALELGEDRARVGPSSDFQQQVLGLQPPVTPLQLEEGPHGAGHADRGRAEGCAVGIRLAIGPQEGLPRGAPGGLLPVVEGLGLAALFLKEDVAAPAEVAGLGVIDAERKGRGEGGVEGVATILEHLDGQLRGLPRDGSHRTLAQGRRHRSRSAHAHRHPEVVVVVGHPGSLPNLPV